MALRQYLGFANSATVGPAPAMQYRRSRHVDIGLNPDRRHLARRFALTLVVLLAVAGISGLLVGLVLKAVVLFLIGLA